MNEFETLNLYSYWRSSAAYRVRIVLNLKGLTHNLIPVNLIKDGGEHRSEQYLKMNPQGLVPIMTDGERVIRQSLAIIEYLEEAYPDPSIMPSDLRSRARVRAIAQLIVSDIHPLNNLRVLSYLKNELSAPREERDSWYRHWIAQGFKALEEELANSPMTGEFCEGDEPGLADVCLIPQVYNALRFDRPMQDYSAINRIYGNCMSLDAFQQAAPENQPDAGC